MSDTPRTNKMAVDLETATSCADIDLWVPYQFCRDMERELISAQGHAEHYKELADEYKGACKIHLDKIASLEKRKDQLDRDALEDAKQIAALKAENEILKADKHYCDTCPERLK